MILVKKSDQKSNFFIKNPNLWSTENFPKRKIFGQKLAKNRNFGQKSKFSLKIEIFVKNRNVR